MYHIKERDRFQKHKKSIILIRSLPNQEVVFNIYKLYLYYLFIDVKTPMRIK